MKLLNKLNNLIAHIPFPLQCTLGCIPVLNRLIFKNIYQIAEIEIENNNHKAFSDLVPNSVEYIMAQFEYGIFLRNRYLLWHPRNPYTSIPYKNYPGSDSMYHPDNFSDLAMDIILTHINNTNERQ